MKTYNLALTIAGRKAEIVNTFNSHADARAALEQQLYWCTVRNDNYQWVPDQQVADTLIAEAEEARADREEGFSDREIAAIREGASYGFPFIYNVADYEDYDTINILGDSFSYDNEDYAITEA